MNFSDFASLCYELEKTPGRLAKIAAAADYLKRLKPDEIRYGVAFLSGRPFPVSDPRTLDIGPGAFAHAAEIPVTEPSVSPSLTLKDVARNFAQIAEAGGKGSRAAKYARLRELVEMTDAHERPILFRLLHNELRIGLHDGLIQDAIARASGTDLKTVRRAALFLSDLAEVVAVGKDGRPLPFQELMRRFRRIHGIQSAATEIPLFLHLFDCLLLDGRSLIDQHYHERWLLLEQMTGGKYLARQKVTGDKSEAEVFLDDAIAAGHEGLMAKALYSPYMPGNRGKLWFKIKPAETVDCVILAADRGSGRRRGWLSNYHLAVGDGSGGFAPVGKTFKGLTDKEFTAMTARLKGLQQADDGYTVAVKPEIVVEVTYNEIQRSPQYSSGFALRFARITRIRDDKNPEQATTLKELQSFYERQFISKNRREA